MKTIRILFAMIIAFASTQSVSAQSDKSQRAIGISTASVKVYGVCEMCKNKIEKAAYSVEGIKSAVWDENTKQLTVTYGVFSKAAIDNIQKKIASIGYSTEKYSADAAAYKQLPGCCQYQRKQS